MDHGQKSDQVHNHHKTLSNLEVSHKAKIFFTLDLSFKKEIKPHLNSRWIDVISKLNGYDYEITLLKTFLIKKHPHIKSSIHFQINLPTVGSTCPQDQPFISKYHPNRVILAHTSDLHLGLLFLPRPTFHFHTSDLIFLRK